MPLSVTVTVDAVLTDSHNRTIHVDTNLLNQNAIVQTLAIALSAILGKHLQPADGKLCLLQFRGIPF